MQLKKGALEKLRHIRTILAIPVFVAIGLFTYNQVANLHFHIAPDGSIVAHAHPYGNASDNPLNPGHIHSDKNMAWIATMMQFTAVCALVAVTLVLFNKVNKSSKPLLIHTALFSRVLMSNCPLRAPPVSA